jgi:predicted hydrocarbon binding protein
MKETFEAVVGGPVDVTLVESIKRGGERCKFVVRV